MWLSRKHVNLKALITGELVSEPDQMRSCNHSFWWRDTVAITPIFAAAQPGIHRLYTPYILKLARVNYNR